MKLSILIMSIRKREALLNRLLGVLKPQLNGDVELIIKLDKGQTKIGKKRNEALAEAKGDYVVFIDDDDLVPVYYIKEVFKALETNPDCVGFKGVITTDGKNPKEFIHTLKCKKWHEKNGIYYRNPNHLNPIKRELAITVKFPEINHGEDHKWSEKLLPKLKTEVFIDKVMYKYLYISNKKRT